MLSELYVIIFIFFLYYMFFCLFNVNAMCSSVLFNADEIVSGTEIIMVHYKKA